MGTSVFGVCASFCGFLIKVIKYSDGKLWLNWYWSYLLDFDNSFQYAKWRNYSKWTKDVQIFPTFHIILLCINLHLWNLRHSPKTQRWPIKPNQRLQTRFIHNGRINNKHLPNLKLQMLPRCFFSFTLHLELLIKQ